MSEHLMISPLATGGLEVRVRARKCDDVLYASSQGSQLLKLSDQNIHDAVSDLLLDPTIKQRKRIYPFADTYKMRTLTGTFVLDAILVDQLAPELLLYVVEQDLPPKLLNQYTPE